MRSLLKTNEGKVREMATMVPQVLKDPKSIWAGLMRETGEDEGWCYAGFPDHQYVGVMATRIDPPANSIFLVFINKERTIHEWYWDDCDPNNPCYPVDAVSDDGSPVRFKRNLL